MKKRQAGFTLVELMIVVAIIGVLAAIAMPKFASLVRKSQEGSTKGNLGAIRSALTIYYGDMGGQYPSDMTSLTISGKYLNIIPAANTPSYHTPASWAHDGTVNEFSDSGNWQYDNVASDGNYGTVWVNCTHTDTKGVFWSSY